MTSGKFIQRLLWRILLICAITGLFAYLIFKEEKIFVSTILIAANALLVIELLRFARIHYDDVEILFRSLESGDFSNRLKAGKNKPLMRKWINEIIDHMQSLQREKTEKQEIIQLIIDHIPTGIICFKNKNTCVIHNQFAAEILGHQILVNLKQIEVAQPEIAGILDGDNKTQQIFELQKGGQTQKVIIHRTDFTLNHAPYNLLTIENITQAMDRKEMESWQKLMRILHHELVNSITPIISLSESMLDEIVSPDHQASDMREAMEAIHNRSKNLLRFSNGLKSVSGIQLPVKERISVQQVLRHVLNLNPEWNQLRRLTWTENKSIWIDCDPAHLQHVLLNLLKNAFEATTESQDKSIDVTVDSEQSCATINITDSGCGMNDEEVARAFVPFYTTKTHGQGIGLSLAKHLVQLNMGTMLINSKRNEGTTITIRLPLSNGDNP